MKFRPGGLTSLTGHSARDLRDVTVPATTVFPRRHHRRAARARARHLDRGVPARRSRTRCAALRTEPEPDYVTVLDTVTAMLEDRTLVRVAQVEERCGIGTRTLQRLFEKYVGVSPKWVLSRYRMHDVVTRLDEGYDGPLADLAAEHGWFDQAHFTREFTELVGVPPSGYVAGAAPSPGGGFSWEEDLPHRGRNLRGEAARSPTTGNRRRAEPSPQLQVTRTLPRRGAVRVPCSKVACTLRPTLCGLVSGKPSLPAAPPRRR